MVREVKDGQYENPAGEPLPVEVYRQPRPAARRPAVQALGLRHVPRDARPDDSSPWSAPTASASTGPARSEFTGHVRGPGVPAGKIDLDFDLPRTVYFRGETDQGEGRRQLPVRDAAGEPADRGRPAARRPRPPRRDRRRRAVRVRAGDRRVRRGADRSSSSPACRRTTSPRRPRSSWPSAPSASSLTRPATSTSTASASPSRRPRPGRPGRADRPGPAGGREGRSGSCSRDGVDRARGLAARRRRPTRRRARLRSALKIDDEEGGTYVLRVSGTDRFENAVLADRLADDLGQEGRDEAPHPDRPGRRSRSARRPRSTSTTAGRPARRCWRGRPTASSRTRSSRSRRATTRSRGRWTARSSPTSP